MRYSTLAAAALLALPLWVSAATVGSDSASFLEVPMGANAASLGGAFTASAGDAYSTAWNPAGLSQAPAIQVATTKRLYVEGSHYDYLGTAVPLGSRFGLGVSVQSFSLGAVEGFDSSRSETDAFSVDFKSYNVGLGIALGRGFSFGATAKALTSRIADTSASTTGADLGLLYNKGALRVAAVAANLGEGLRYSEAVEPLPTSATLGTAYSLTKPLTVSLDMVSRRSGDTFPRGGLEWRLGPAVAVRGGYDTSGPSALGSVSAGAGLTVLGQQVDYAWVPGGEVGSTHYFSLMFSFGARSKDKTAEVPKASVPKVVSVEKERSTLPSARDLKLSDNPRWPYTASSWTSLRL